MDIRHHLYRLIKRNKIQEGKAITIGGRYILFMPVFYLQHLISWFILGCMDMPIVLTGNPQQHFSRIARIDETGTFLDSYSLFKAEYRLSEILILALSATLLIEVLFISHKLFFA